MKTFEKLSFALSFSFIAATTLAAPTSAAPTAAEPPTVGACTSGDFRWTSIRGGIDMVPKWMTFTSVGTLRDCSGWPGITSGTFTGVHDAMADCMHPADGPITVHIVWNNGQVSTVAGPWPVTMQQPAIGNLLIIDGLGIGGWVRIAAVYEMMTPDQVMGCMGPGVTTGIGWLNAAML